jgi:integrase/recombinase XerD
MTRNIPPADLSSQPGRLRIPTGRSEPLRQVFEGLACVDVRGKDHLERYVQHLIRRNFRRLTILQSVSTLKLFLGFLATNGSCLEGLGRRDLEAFIEAEQDRGLKLWSVKTKLDRVYAFLGFLIEEELVPPETLVRKIRLKLPQYLPRAIDPSDVRKLIGVVDNVRDRAMILVLLRTGMRISELLALRVGDVHIQDQRIVIHEGAKTRRGRVVYFSTDARDALEAWLKKRDSQAELLFHARGRSTLGYTSCRDMFEKYLRRAELAHSGYTLHCLRHTFASELLNAGMRLEYLQELLGHDSIQITRRYAKLTNTNLEAEYFRAMARIQRGGIHGTYRADRKLQTVPETKQ